MGRGVVGDGMIAGVKESPIAAVLVLLLGSADVIQCAAARFEAAEKYVYQQRCEAGEAGRQALLDSFAAFLLEEEPS